MSAYRDSLGEQDRAEYDDAVRMAGLTLAQAWERLCRNHMTLPPQDGKQAA